jgi:hypothetical protein
MPFFDHVPILPKERRVSSPRRWLGWLAIPIAVLFAWLAESGRHDGGLDDGKDIFIWIGVIAGGTCIVLSRPQHRGLKWFVLILYLFVMPPIISMIDFMVNGMQRLF